MKESKTIQVYPDDAIVNATIGEYESFGWELIGNQRMQEYEGTTHGIDGSSTKHYSTFNKLTFSREKDSSWYEEVTKLEREYNATNDTIKSYKARKPIEDKSGINGELGVLVGVVLYMFFLIPGIIYSIARGAKKAKLKKRYQKELAEYESVYPAKIKELEGQLSVLRARAEKCILGKE